VNPDDYLLPFENNRIPAEFNDAIPYLILGHYINWGRSDVDNADAELVDKLLILVDEYKDRLSGNNLSIS